jgi:predicted ArsR family transcriptional regulator
MPHTLAPSVVAFVTEHVRTLAELQLLMTIIQSGDRWWDATAAARELGLTIHDARRALDHLGAHNLLDIRITGDVRYQYRPGTTELREGAEACAAAYRSRPIDLAQLVTGPSVGSVRDFADAFRVRRKRDG